MSLVDRTNEEIALSLHLPLGYGDDPLAAHQASIYIDADLDSSFTPDEWVGMSFTDEDHDSDTFRLTYEEAGLIHDRLGLILGRANTRGWEVRYGRRNRETGRGRELNGAPLPEWWGESQETWGEHVQRLVGPWGPIDKEVVK